MLTILKKGAQLTCLLLLGTLILILTAATWVYFNPERAWQLVQNRYLPADLKVQWKDLDFQIINAPGWTWDLHFRVSDLRITKSSPPVALPITEIIADVRVRPFNDERRVDIQWLKVHAPDPISLGPFSESDPKEEKNYYEQARLLLERLDRVRQIGRIKHLEIDIENLQLQPHWRMNVQLRSSAETSASLAFTLGLRPMGQKTETLNSNGIADLKKLGSEENFLNGSLLINADQIKVQAPFKATFYQNELRLHSRAQFTSFFKRQSLRLTPDLAVSLNSQRLELKFKTAILGLPAPVKQLQDIEGRFTLPLEEGRQWSAAAAPFEIKAPVDLFFINPDMRPPLEKSCRCQIPETIAATLKGKLWLQALVEKPDRRRQVAEVSLRLESLSNKLFLLDFGGGGQVFRHATQWTIEPWLDSHLVLYSFQGLRRFLDAQGVLIPAPFSVLDGRVEMKAQGPVDIQSFGTKRSQFSATATLETSLSSETQNVRVNADLKATADSGFRVIDVQTKVRVHEFKVELPPVDPMGGSLKVFNDRRIQLKPPVAKRPPRVQVLFDLEVETTSPGAIKLLSPLADPYVPITVSAQRKQGGDLEGFVKVEAFSVHYLRRTLKVDSLIVELDRGSPNDFPIAGEFHVQQTDYKVMILLGGSIGSPRVALNSDPYLDRGDIVSVLLYDRTSDQLGGGDAENVGNAQAAMAERAIGLLGIWAFAATPIRSFSYSPATKQYTATVLLGDGITAGVGTGSEQSTIFELRKRLSRRWIISASWVPEENRNDEGRVVLQWERRF